MARNIFSPARAMVSSFVLVLGTIPSGDLRAAQLGQSFNYQGRVFQADGATPLTEVVDLKLSIYDPLAQCLLYEEHQDNIDLGLSAGYFSVAIGSSLGADGVKRTSDDPLLPMADVFSNAQEIRAPGTPNCTLGYTPSSGQGRLLRVTVTPEGDSPITLSPDLVIGVAPLSTVAETLQGLTPSDFIQTSTNVTQANMESLTGGADIGTSLHHHDGRYAQSGQAASFSSLTIGGAEVCTKTYADQKLGGNALDLTGIGAGTGDGKALKWDATASKWVAYTPADASGNITGTASNVTGIVAIDHGGTGVTSLGTSQVLSSNSSGNGVTAITAGGIGDVLMQTGGGLGFATIADSNISATAAITRSKIAAAAGNKGALVYNDAVTGALASLASGTSGQVLQSGGAGVAPSWADFTSSQWTTNGSNIGYTAGNVGIGTTAPNGNLQIHATTGVNPTLYFSDADVNHGMTGIVPEIGIVGAFGTGDTNGTGFRIKGLTGSGLVPALQLDAYTSATPTTPAVIISGRKRSLTNAVDLAAGETLFQLRNGATPVLTALGSGSIGIGTATPSGALHVNKTSAGPLLSLTNSGAGRASIDDSTGNSVLTLQEGSQSTKVQLHTAGNSYFNGGNLGIGTATPGSHLEISGSDINDASTAIQLTNTASATSYRIGAGILGESQSGFSIKQTSGAGLLAMSDSGLIGINDRAPAAVLQVSGAGMGSSDLLRIGSASGGGEKVTVTSTGHVGIGTSSPLQPLHVVGGVPRFQSTTGAQSIMIDGASGGYNANVIFANGGTTKGKIYYNHANTAIMITDATNSDLMTLKAGNVGIGTSTPQTTLDVNGAARLAANASEPFACDAAHGGSIALTSTYVMCTCNGAGWYFSDTLRTGAVACSW